MSKPYEKKNPRVWNRVEEWDINRVLPFLFLTRRINGKRMLYLFSGDGEHIPWVHSPPDKTFRTEFRDRHELTADYGRDLAKELGLSGWRPDGLALDDGGRCWLVEVKWGGAVTSTEDCANVIAQAVTYLDNLFHPPEGFRSRYRYLDVLTHLHWRRNHYNFQHGKYPGVQELHKHYFPVREGEVPLPAFETEPGILLVLPPGSDVGQVKDQHASGAFRQDASAKLREHLEPISGARLEAYQQVALEVWLLDPPVFQGACD